MSCSLFGNHGGSVRLQVLLFVNLNEFRPSAFSSREGGISKNFRTQCILCLCSQLAVCLSISS